MQNRGSCRYMSRSCSCCLKPTRNGLSTRGVRQRGLGKEKEFLPHLMLIFLVSILVNEYIYLFFKDLSLITDKHPTECS